MVNQIYNDNDVSYDQKNYGGRRSMMDNLNYSIDHGSATDDHHYMRQ